MTSENLIRVECGTRLCDWGIYLDGQLQDHGNCYPGRGTCAAGVMITTDSFPNTHDAVLKQAAIDIQAILDDANTHTPEGKQLAFMNVQTGAMLGWVEHTFLTSKDIAEFADQLGLEPVTVARGSTETYEKGK